MASITQRVSNYLGGVSRQADDQKSPGQVRECLNGYPDLTFGLTKRPGFKHVINLGTGTTYDASKWFYIHRDGDERYIGCIKPGSIAITGNGTSGATSKNNLATTTSGSGTGLKVNLTAADGVVTGISIAEIGSGYAASDTITIASGVAGTGANVTGTIILGDIDIWNAATGTSCAVTYGTGAQGYLTGGRTNYDVLTVQDTSIITNNLVVANKVDNQSFVSSTRATLVLTDTAYSSTYSVTLNAGGGASDQTFTHTSSATETYDTLIAALKTGIDNLSISGLTVTTYAASLELDRVVSGTRTAFSITCKGGPANNKLAVFQDQVDNVSQIPTQSYHNRIVKIINTNSSGDTYFAKFVADDGVSGTGYWEETLDPSQSPGLNTATMPHELVNTADNVFVFRKGVYTDRIVGDDVTNSHPSFVGAKIQQSFFHNNRLGFLTNDNVSLSQAGQFFNFYHTSAQTIIASDPVDLSAATTKPVALHGVIPTSQGLILFSRNQQFIMASDDGYLTPGSTTIKAISSYEMDTGVDPVDMGGTINFISKTPSYTRTFSMITRGQNENPIVSDAGRTVKEWVPADIDSLIASPQNQFIAMSSQSSRYVYLFRTYVEGDQLLIKAWFNWQLAGTVQTLAVDSDDMYAVTKQGNQFTLSKASLSQSPEDAIIVSNKGERINPCIDLYATASSVVFDTTNDFSKCYIPWNNVTDLIPVLIIKGSTATGQYIESGFTITPEVITNDGSPYFKVPGKNLVSVASDVIVGWKYDFNVELPRVAFKVDQTGTVSDFTANLIIARMKFAVGLSGVMGFKLKSKGIRQGKREYVADGTTTVFPWSESDFDYVDKDQIKLKINNIESTAFTVSGDYQITLDAASTILATGTGNGTATAFAIGSTPNNPSLIRVTVNGVLKTAGTDYVVVGDYVSFLTAPTNTHPIKIYSADDILIYLDEWYSLNPVQVADDYLAGDIPISEQTTFSIPIHQKPQNFQLRIFNDTPFPVSLNSMMWEGNYTPKFYRRT